MQRTRWWQARTLVGVTAFLLPLLTGVLGFFPLDQSIVWDGAYRIVHGQVYFRDFSCAYGISSFLIVAALFFVTGTAFIGYLCSSAVINVAGALAAFSIGRHVSGGNALGATAAGLCSAVWLVSLTGTVTAWETATILVFMGVALQLHRPSACFWSGACAAAAFFAKQNIGVAGTFLLLVFLALQASQLRLSWLLLYLRFLSGLACLTALLVAPIAILGDFDSFVRHYFLIPRQIAEQRLSGGASLAGCLPAVLCGLIICFCIRFGMSRTPRSVLELSVLAGLVSWSALLSITAFDAPATSICPALIACTTISASVPRSNSTDLRDRLHYGVCAIISVLFILLGATLSIRRTVDDAFGFEPHDGSGMSQTTFASLSDSRLWPLYWRTPTWVNDSPPRSITPEQVERIVTYLAASSGAPAVFGHHTFLYPVINRPSLMPLLWLHRGVTFDPSAVAKEDAAMVSALVRGETQCVLMEDEMFWGASVSIHEFPQLEAHLRSQYRYRYSLEPFELVCRLPHPLGSVDSP